MPVVWCTLSSMTAYEVASRLLSFLSGFVVNCLLYQLSIQNTTHCWCILLHVVCNLTAALSFTEGALYRARPHLCKMRRCALLPSIAITDFSLPWYGIARWCISKKRCQASSIKTAPHLLTLPFIFALTEKKQKQQSRALMPLF